MYSLFIMLEEPLPDIIFLEHLDFRDSIYLGGIRFRGRGKNFLERGTPQGRSMTTIPMYPWMMPGGRKGKWTSSSRMG